MSSLVKYGVLPNFLGGHDLHDELGSHDGNESETGDIASLQVFPDVAECISHVVGGLGKDHKKGDDNDYSLFDEIDLKGHADYFDRHRSGSIMSFASDIRGRADSISSLIDSHERDRSSSIFSTGSMFGTFRGNAINYDPYVDHTGRGRVFSVDFSLLPTSLLDTEHTVDKVGGVIGSEISTEDVGRSLNNVNNVKDVVRQVVKEKKPYGGKRPRTIFASMKKFPETKAIVHGMTKKIVVSYSNDDSDSEEGDAEFEAYAARIIQHTPSMSPLCTKPRMIGTLTPDQRRVKLLKFLEKREKRVWKKKVKYGCRKKLADSRPRVKGRFVPRAVQNQVLESTTQAPPSTQEGAEISVKVEPNQTLIPPVAPMAVASAASTLPVAYPQTAASPLPHPPVVRRNPVYITTPVTPSHMIVPPKKSDIAIASNGVAVASTLPVAKS